MGIAAMTLLPGGAAEADLPEAVEGGVFPGFQPEIVIPIDGSDAPTSLVLEDFNADGIRDMAVSIQTPDQLDRVDVFLGLGDGSFGPPSFNSVGGLPAEIAAVDINLDGKVDLVTSNRDTDDVSVLRGNGDGSFLPELFFGVGAAPNGIATADVDGDGLPDIVTSSLDEDSVSVLIGDGTGTAFSRNDFSTLRDGGTGGRMPLDLVLNDLNNDGLADIAVITQVDDEVVVMYNLGGGTFASGDFALFYSTGDLPFAINSVDANRDGWPDIVNTNAWDDNVIVLMNNADAAFPTFTAGPPIPVAGSPGGLAVGDLDLDGLVDLAVTGVAADDLHALLGDGVGSFAEVGAWPVREDPTFAGMGDLDRDGDQDVAVTNLNDGTVSILLNRLNTPIGPLPEAFLASPIHDSCQCGVEEVYGVAHVDLNYLDRWELEYRSTSVDAWTVFAESDVDVPSPGAPLADWDTTTLAEGRYLLRLTVISISGLTATDEVVVWISRDFDAADFNFLWGHVGMPSVATVVAGVACPIGTVSDGGCGPVTYTVDRSPLGAGTWTPVDPGNPSYAGGRINDLLASWDTIATSVPDGNYEVRMEGLNACGQQGIVFRAVTVDNTPPVAELTAPMSCAVFHPDDLIEIRGTATDANLLSWNLSVIGGPYANWHTLASGTSSVVNGTFATWDTTGMPECGYVLRLRVTDAAIPNCGYGSRDVIVYRSLGIGINGCMFTDGVEIGATDHWSTTSTN